MPLHHRTLAAAVTMVAVSALSLAAGAAAQVATLEEPASSAEPEQPEAALEFADREEALLAFARCMRENGVEMDDPSASGGGRLFLRGGPDGGDGLDRFSEEFLAAQAACGDILAASRPELDPEAEQELIEQQLALARCLRDGGYPEYPDPVIGGDGRMQRGGGQAAGDLGIDRRSPEFQAAMDACRTEVGLDGFRRGDGPPSGVAEAS